MKNNISIIVPFFNEEENIIHLINAFTNYAKSNPLLTIEVVLVNDGSTDKSLTILQDVRPDGYRIKVISLSKNFGSHAALRAGILNASYDIITFLYADLQDPLELIDKQLEKIKEGFDIVWANRSEIHISITEKLFSSFYNKLMCSFAVSNFPEKGFDIVMFTNKTKMLLNSNPEKNSSIFVQILSFGFKQTSISYQKSKRQFGTSKWTLSKKIKLFIDSFVSYSYFPIRLVTITGITLFIFGLMWAGYIILRSIFFADLNPGWPSLIAILMICFGITNISLGIIAEYLWRTLDGVRNRPLYIIDEIFQKNG